MKTLVAIPCMDMVPTRFLFSCLNLRTDENVEFSLTESSLVYDSRNQLSKKAIEEGFERILWLDSDMVFKPDLFERLSERLDAGYQMVSGLYFKRKQPICPVLYKECGAYEKDGKHTVYATTYDDYPKDSLFEIAACGFGAVMMTVDLLRQIRDRYGPPFTPTLGFGEDLAFCLRVAWMEKTIWCDSSIKLGHVGTAIYDETVWRKLQGITD